MLNIKQYLKFTCQTFTTYPNSWRIFLKTFKRQLVILGSDALWLIFIAAIFSGMVFSIQAFLSLDRFGAGMSIGEYLPISMYRELGPIIAGLVYTGRSGSFVATEIAAMKANGQIDCMDIMGMKLLPNVVLPRFLAILFTFPGLVMIFNVISIIVCFFMTKYHYHFPVVGFFENLKYVIDYKLELAMTLYKSLVFAFAIASSATYHGYFANINAEGVGKAATAAVVWATFSMLVLDFIVTGFLV